jgi:hypothetical protein
MLAAESPQHQTARSLHKFVASRYWRFPFFHPCVIWQSIFCPSRYSFIQRSTPKLHQQTTSSGSKKNLKINGAAAFGCSGLFPVSESRKLIQNFLQSLEPPFLVSGCPSISPVHLGAVRFTDLGYFFPKFLDTL